MPSRLTLSVLSEKQEGNVGKDWKYTLEAKVFCGALTGQGAIRVKRHALESGDKRTPPGPPEPVVIPAGEGGAEISVELHLIATEVDPFQDDVGEKRVSFTMQAPAAGEPAVVEEREITAGVTEEPSGAGNAVLSLGLRLKLESN